MNFRALFDRDRYLSLWDHFRLVITTSFRRDGFLAACGVAAGMIGRRLIGRRLRRYWILRKQRRFDRKHGVDTWEGNGELKPPPDALYGDSRRYEPASSTQLEKLLDALPIDPREYAFIDLGCGKGTALILAVKRGFRAVIGVEFDQELSVSATRNLQQLCQGGLPSCTADVVNSDAAEYSLPNIPSLIFMFNPLGQDTMRAVLRNIETSFAEHPRALYVGYLNPIERDVLESSNHLVSIAHVPSRFTVYEVI